ncbi:MAG: serine/threonine protein kinase [Blastocatellia bacterium]|nr:serine/threonine protein kinase [Blastocatellia bacterium]
MESLQDYEIIKLIGSGSYGLVYMAKDLKNAQLCALKEFSVSAHTVQQFFRELSILFTLDHPNIIKCLNLVYGRGRKNYLIFEYANKGSLRDRIAQNSLFQYKEAADIVRQIALGLAHAHELQIVHRDLKPENILICQNQNGQMVYKVSDLGIACHLANSYDKQGSNGSPLYMAPEQFYDNATYASDVYSLGVIFYEMLTSKTPFEGEPSRLFAAHLKETPDFESIENKQCRKLVADMLQKQQHSRPLIQEVIKRLDDILLSKSLEIQVSQQDRDSVEDRKYFDGWWQLEPVASREIPGGQNLFVLAPWSAANIYISDSRSTDLYEIEKDRLFPQFFSERISTAVVSTPLEVSYFSTKKYIYFFDFRTQVIRKLFAHQTNILRLAVNKKNNSLIYGDSSRLHCCSVDGEQLWRVNCENYYLHPQILVLDSGNVLASSGPARPTISSFDCWGNKKFKIEIDSPILAVFPADRLDTFSVIALGMGIDEPTKFLTFSNNIKISEKELGCGIYTAKLHQNFISLFHTGKKILFVNKDSTQFAEINTEGNVLDDCWVAKVGMYAFLEKIGHRTFLQVKRLVKRKATL